MRIQFVRPYGPWGTGAIVVHPHPGVADVLIRRGIARPVKKAADKKK